MNTHMQMQMPTHTHMVPLAVMLEVVTAAVALAAVTVALLNTSADHPK